MFKFAISFIDDDLRASRISPFIPSDRSFHRRDFPGKSSLRLNNLRAYNELTQKEKIFTTGQYLPVDNKKKSPAIAGLFLQALIF